MMCKKCGTSLGLIFFIIGILYLLHDIGVIVWIFNWWTIAFLLGGWAIFSGSMCDRCRDICCHVAKTPTQKKKKK